MNDLKNTDFFPKVESQDAHLVAPEIYEPYQDREEDLLHEKRLQELQATFDEKLSPVPDDDLGELPYNAEADRKRWDLLEKDFDRVFNEVEQL